MDLAIGNGYSFKISRPMIIDSPKRMYIMIPNTSAGTIEQNLELSKVTINGKAISGYTTVIYIQQRGENVMLCLGG